jgi:hypothetical protein
MGLLGACLRLFYVNLLDKGSDKKMFNGSISVCFKEGLGNYGYF